MRWQPCGAEPVLDGRLDRVLSLGTGQRTGGPNPTVTCQALATRTAEKIFMNEFGQDPFVASLSPTVSTDLSITAALPPELR